MLRTTTLLLLIYGIHATAEVEPGTNPDFCLQPVGGSSLDLTSLMQADFFLKKRDGMKPGKPRKLTVADLDLCLGPEDSAEDVASSSDASSSDDASFQKPADLSSLFQADIHLLKKNHGGHNAEGTNHRTSQRQLESVDVNGQIHADVDSDSELCSEPDDEVASLMQSELVVSRRSQPDEDAGLMVSSRSPMAENEHPDVTLTALFQADIHLLKGKSNRFGHSAPGASVDSKKCGRQDDDVVDEVASLMQADIVLARHGSNQTDFKVVKKHNVTGTLRLKTTRRNSAQVDVAAPADGGSEHNTWEDEPKDF